MYTLDTNILIYYASGEKEVVKFISEQLMRGVLLFLPTLVISEFLSFPALRANEKDLFISLFQKCLVYPLDLEAAITAAEIRRKYRLKLGDSVIAATAKLTKSRLVTRDIKDFRRVKGLKTLVF